MNGRPLENDKYYSVITNSFLASKYVKNLRRNVKNKKAEIENVINMFSKGLTQLATAETTVEDLQEYLRNEEPKLEQAKKDTTKLIEEL